MHAEKCPICSGSGKAKRGETKFPCYGCDGRGWVEVGDSFPSLPNIPATPPLPQPWCPPEWPIIHPPRYYPYHYWSGEDTFIGPTPTPFRYR